MRELWQVIEEEIKNAASAHALMGQHIDKVAQTFQVLFLLL